MTETRTPRMRLPQWSSGTTDSPSREDFNEAFFNLEKWAGRFEYGPLADRPSPEVEGRYYVDTDGVIYRDTGTQWAQVGFPKNAVKITKTEGNEPALWIDLPASTTADAIRTTHDNKNRFRVQANGDVVASSTRLYQSDAAAPANNLPHTVGVTSKSANASGVTVYGAAAQSGNLIETKTSTSADLTQITASGDVNTLGRLMAGSLTPQDAQLYIQNSGTTRPALLARTNTTLPNANTAVAVENQSGATQLLKLDNSGRLAVGNRDNKAINAADNVAVNSNYTATNSGTSSLIQAQLVFRNTASGFGVGGLVVRQQPGDTSAGSSLGVVAGTAGADGLAPERVRFGVNDAKHGARFVANEPDWAPVVVRGAVSQAADLLLAQDSDENKVAGINYRGDGVLRSLATTGTGLNAFSGPITSAGEIQGTNLRVIQGSGNNAGVLSQIKTTATTGQHFLAQDENGAAKARLNRDGTLEIGMDTNAVAAGAVLLTMRGQQYRQNGRKLQSYDQAAQRWSTFESAFAAEYYTQTSQSVKNAWVAINWFGETNDTENAFGFTSGSSKITVPFTGWYDVRALAHCSMNFTGAGSATFRINNNLELKYRRDYAKAVGFDVVTLSLNDLVYLNANDTLEFMIQIDSFFFTATTLNSGDYRSRCAIRFAGYA